jgi:hypothetical protein
MGSKHLETRFVQGLSAGESKYGCHVAEVVTVETVPVTVTAINLNPYVSRTTY